MAFFCNSIKTDEWAGQDLMMQEACIGKADVIREAAVGSICRSWYLLLRVIF
jgi:hypothetical protein